MINKIKTKVKELFSTKQVDLVIGYKRAPDGVSAMPCFIYKEDMADILIWDAYCVYNLSNYLNPVRDVISSGVKESSGKKTGIIAKPCDIKSIMVLLQENQLKREDVFIIGIECSGVAGEKRTLLPESPNEEIGFDARCKRCRPAVPAVYDVLITHDEKKPRVQLPEDDPYESVRKLEAKSVHERLKFWHEEFSRCIRCYACRQICPMCYCPRCVADQSQPAWFSRSVSKEGNFSWNVNRAMHLAGRCIGCGECERACPAGIPLGEINKKIAKDARELFNYEAGLNAEQKPLLSCFDKNDPDDWIK